MKFVHMSGAGNDFVILDARTRQLDLPRLARSLCAQTGADGFMGYNTFRNSTGEDTYGSSLRAFLKKQGYFGCVLTTIRDRRSLEAK